MRRSLPLLALAAVLLLAAPAGAHEEINPSTIPTGKPVFFTLDAANEKTVDLTTITLTAPSGLAFGSSTRSPSGWTADRTDEAITWTGGGVKPDQFDQWGFEIEGADQPGTLTYKVTLGFADGSRDDVDVAVTATAAGSTTGAAAGTTTKTSKTGNGLAVVAIGLAAAALAFSLAGRSRRGTPPGDEPGKDW